MTKRRTSKGIGCMALAGLAALLVACVAVGLFVTGLGSALPGVDLLPGPTPSATMRPTAVPAPSATPAAGIMAQVTHIVDGDTIDVEIDGQTYRVRYIGMDTPERGMPYYAEATQANAGLVAGGQVRLEKDVSETDRYERLLRYVYVGDTMVNAELVRQGYAQAATFPPDVKYEARFRALQQEAQAAGRGLWAGAERPTPAPAGTASGSQPVVIDTIFYDGVVPRVESDEYVAITNQGDTPVDLHGWRLNAGAREHEFTFPAFSLQPGQTCRVYTNEQHPEWCGFSFASSQALWNNQGDCGRLYDAAGEQVAEYCY
jgi:endonuclease YncB( thermonuclease family)